MSADSLDIAIIGGGPIGLEAGLRASELGHRVTLLEAGRFGESVRRWGHVRLFSPWSMSVSEAGLRALRSAGLSAPPADAFPTGTEYAERYLEPIGRVLSERATVRTNTRVVGLSRDGILKGELIGDSARAERPFRLVLDVDGREQVLRADVVADASGTFADANHLGPGGGWALGERAADGRIERHLPDILGAERARFAGKRTLVVGSGYSAITQIAALLSLAKEVPGTEVLWRIRDSGAPYTRIEGDPLPQRDLLAALGNSLTEGDQRVDFRGGTQVTEVALRNGSRVEVQLDTADGPEAIVVDELLANVGYRPNTDLFRELQVHQCWASEGPMKLAAVLLSQSGDADCLSQASAGPDALRSPEPNFYLLGSKSYGRNSSFLIRLGVEQVDEWTTLL